MRPASFAYSGKESTAGTGCQPWAPCVRISSVGNANTLPQPRSRPAEAGSSYAGLPEQPPPPPPPTCARMIPLFLHLVPLPDVADAQELANHVCQAPPQLAAQAQAIRSGRQVILGLAHVSHDHLLPSLERFSSSHHGIILLHSPLQQTKIS